MKLQNKAHNFHAREVLIVSVRFSLMCTRYAGPQGDECNGIDRVLEIDEAAEVTGDVADDGCAHSDHSNGDDEAGVAVSDA